MSSHRTITFAVIAMHWQVNLGHRQRNANSGRFTREICRKVARICNRSSVVSDDELHKTLPRKPFPVRVRLNLSPMHFRASFGALH
jgi:hypothetical protein